MTEDAIVLWAPIATTAIGLGAIVAATGFRRGDLISPFSTCLMLLVAIFGIRPILMFTNSSYWFYGLNVSEGFQQASLIGLCGIAAMSCGYFMSRISRKDSVEVLGYDEAEDYSAFGGMGLAVGLAGLVLLTWLGLTAYVGGGLSFIVDSFGGRSADIGIAYAGVPAGVPALPVAAGTIVALSRIKISRLRSLKLREDIGYWLIVGLAVVPPVALGSRRFLIPTIIAGLTGACVRSWTRRVSIPMLAAATIVVLILAVIPFIRSAGSRIKGDGLVGSAAEHIGATGVVGVINDFFLSYDTEMFSYVAYLTPRLGSDSSDIPFGLGRGTILELALAPIPHSMLPIQTWSNTLLTSIFGGECGIVNCPVPSAFGTLYFDWSFPGLILGCVLAGLLFARYGTWINTLSGIRLTLVLLLAAFAPLMARGNAVSQAWIATQVLVAVLVAALIQKVLGDKLGNRRRPPSHPWPLPEHRVASTTEASVDNKQSKVNFEDQTQQEHGAQKAHASAPDASLLEPARKAFPQ